MIHKNIHIGNINVSDTYGNVVHINNNINSLYSSTSSMYKLYDGNGYKIPFSFSYGRCVVVGGVIDTNFKFNTDDVVFNFENCEYDTLINITSTATINNILTAYQTTVSGSNNQLVADTKIRNNGVVNHTLTSLPSHPLSNENALTNEYDAIANYEYLSFKTNQLKDEFIDYAKSFANPKDALVVAYNNNGKSVDFKISESQLSTRDKERNKLTVVIIGTLVSYIGESDLYSKLYIKHSAQQTPEMLQEQHVKARASTGDKGDAECSINVMFLAVKDVDVNKLYTVYMDCGGNIGAASITVLCGEVIDYGN